MTAVFEGAGPLGLGLASRSVRGKLVVTEASGTAAALGLRAGLLLHSVEGQVVQGLEFDQVLHLIKTSPRPLELGFEAGAGSRRRDCHFADAPLHPY